MRGWIDRSLGLSLAGLVCLAAVPPAAQTAGGVLEGRAAFGDWHADRPGLRRIIKPQDLPSPQPSASVTNMVRVSHRTDQKRLVPSGFTATLFASKLAGPRIIRTAPNGDIFVAESKAGRISVLRPDRGAAAMKSVFTSGLKYPFGIAFYPPGRDPQWVYIADTDAILSFPYRRDDLAQRGDAAAGVPRLPLRCNATTVV